MKLPKRRSRPTQRRLPRTARRRRRRRRGAARAAGGTARRRPPAAAAEATTRPSRPSEDGVARARAEKAARPARPADPRSRGGPRRRARRRRADTGRAGGCEARARGGARRPSPATARRRRRRRRRRGAARAGGRNRKKKPAAGVVGANGAQTELEELETEFVEPEVSAAEGNGAVESVAEPVVGPAGEPTSDDYVPMSEWLDEIDTSSGYTAPVRGPAPAFPAAYEHLRDHLRRWEAVPRPRGRAAARRPALRTARARRSSRPSCSSAATARR